jgi:ABC-2 type transport system ATP-binding protein
VVLQSNADHAELTVAELVRHFAGFYPRPHDPDEVIARVGLEGSRDTRTRALSGGQRRRLDVAMGIIGRPELLFLDEPTAGFDPQARRDFHDLVHRLSDLEGTSILLTTHDLAEAERLADRILILAAGRIVADGSAEALTRQVAGSSEVRWARGGERFLHATSDPTPFVRRLFEQHGEEITDLEVRRASLEDTYIAMVQRFESGDRTAPVLAEAAR